MFEQKHLKVEINLFSKTEKDYLISIWGKAFSTTIKNECENIIKIMLIFPITNVRLEWMLCCMLKVKTDWRNRSTNERLNHHLRTSEEWVPISTHNPNGDIAKWYNKKVTNFKGTKLQKYLEK